MNTQRYYSISLGLEEEREENTKCRSDEKVVGFISASLFPASKLEAVTQGVTRRVHQPTQRKTQGAGIVKGWKDMRDHGAFQIHSRKSRITRAYPP